MTNHAALQLVRKIVNAQLPDGNTLETAAKQAGKTVKQYIEDSPNLHKLVKLSNWLTEQRINEN